MAYFYYDPIDKLLVISRDLPFNVLKEYFKYKSGYQLPFFPVNLDNNIIESFKDRNFILYRKQNIFSYIRFVRVKIRGEFLIFGARPIKSSSGIKVYPIFLLSEQLSNYIEEVGINLIEKRKIEGEFRFTLNLSNIEKKLIEIVENEFRV